MVKPITELPDWESAPLEDICAPLSGIAESPRSSARGQEGQGYFLNPAALKRRVQDLKRKQTKRGTKP